MLSSPSAEWKPTACILCECNCGIEVQLEGRRIARVRGDKNHPASQGYLCEKAQRLDYYQNGRDRLTQPMRRTESGDFEPIDWDTAIREVSERLKRVGETYGGSSILYYGGGGQGNHFPGAYATATRRAFGSRYRSNPLAQEKTGEFWVNDRMIGTHTRADFEHCDVGLFLGKNPWFSHSVPRARVVLREISKDPNRTLIVVDPRRTRSAELADIHLQVLPGRDAWLLSAILAILIQEKLVDEDFVAEHTTGFDALMPAFSEVPIADYCEYAGVPEDQVRQAALAVGRAKSFASFEDLGVQMNHHSTVCSYLHKLLWSLTGNIGKPGAHYVGTPLLTLADGRHKRDSPVTGSRIIGGMIPCNVLADEILLDHPERFRAMIVEATNPAHSLAESRRFREACRALDTLVVIDVAMTETAREADYVLPASTQYEKAEATFFNFEFPENCFHLRAPILDAPEDDGACPLPEAEIHTRLVEASGALDGAPLEALSAAAAKGLEAYGPAFVEHIAFNPKWMGLAPVILYRTLGPTLPQGLEGSAVLWGLVLGAATKIPESLARAGFNGSPLEATNKLFRAMLEQSSGVVFAVDKWEEVLGRLKTADGKIQLHLPDLLDVVQGLRDGPEPANPDYPFILCAGERRSFTANTILRDPHWRRSDSEGAMRISPTDAEKYAVQSGDTIRLTTEHGTVVVHVEVHDMMREGHISLPNGTGLSNVDAFDDTVKRGIAPNELTSAAHRDPFVGTPWHKNVPARLERV